MTATLASPRKKRKWRRWAAAATFVCLAVSSVAWRELSWRTAPAYRKVVSDDFKAWGPGVLLYRKSGEEVRADGQIQDGDHTRIRYYTSDGRRVMWSGTPGLFEFADTGEVLYSIKPGDKWQVLDLPIELAPAPRPSATPAP